MYRHKNIRGRPNAFPGYGHYARSIFPTNALNYPATHRDIDYNDSSGYNAIFSAVHEGKLIYAHKLLKEDLVEKEFQGRTLMHVAAAKGHEQIVCLLCQRNARIDRGDRDGNSPLHLAIKGNHTDLIHLFVKESTVNLTNSIKEAPLHIATANNQIQIVQLLLDNGANSNEQDANGSTPLHIAVKMKRPNLKIITLLVEHEANGNLLSDELFTPLYHAVSSGNIEIVQILVKYGAHIDKINKDNKTPLILAVEKNNAEMIRQLLHSKYRDSIATNTMTPLHYAAKNGKLEIVKLLIANECNTVNIKNNDSQTPLYFATFNGHLEIVKYLIENGGKIESASPDNESLLHVCATNGRIEIFKFFLDCGAIIDVKTNRLETPLHFAISKGNLNIVKCLLESGANINARTQDNETPLHLAVKTGHDKIVEEILNHGANINSVASGKFSALTFAVKSRKKNIVQLFIDKGCKDFQTDTENDERALHVAAKNGDEIIFKILLNAGCSLNINCKGKKPIHVAAIFGHVKIIELLVKNGADINSKKRFDETPLHLAAASGRVAAVKFLLNAGAKHDLLTNRHLIPLEYVLDRERHTAIMIKRSVDVLSGRRAALFNVENSNAIWSVNSLMFEKYLDIVELLLIKTTADNFDNLSKINCFTLACQINVIKEIPMNSVNACKSITENNKNVEFQPDIVQCIFNYQRGHISNDLFKTVISTAIKQNSPEVLKCLLEYNVCDTFNNIVIDCSQCNIKTLTIIIDHIENSNIICKLLYNSKVRQDVQNFRETSLVTTRAEESVGIRPLQAAILRLELFRFDHLTENLILNKNTYIDTLKLLIARLVQLRSISGDENLLELKETKALADYGLSEFYTDCEIQIINARETKIHLDFDVSYYDILSQPVDKIANFVRQKELMKVLELSFMKFPAYGEFLKRSIEKGSDRKELIDMSANCLLNVIYKNYKIQLPSLVIDKIFKNLSVIDLRRLQQAGRFLDKKPLYTRTQFGGRRRKIN
ncbi:ankyrin-3-like [Leptopilina boulardi]|uniref:ankyrin-3-like n=1 Tax=Leptopilina boulardi TaxID=63433 RepID=UPI0021F5F50A|nr:ankyrin-3-like [Leptopilina boulardi]XP_051168999.1 ankyrin-3-like [Leptopilina boulardi]